jgi:hypothetical protein
MIVDCCATTETLDCFTAGPELPFVTHCWTKVGGEVINALESQCSKDLA